MDFVCKDDDGDWYYFPLEKQYRRLKGEKQEIRGRISGEYLPDPNVLLERRRELYPSAPLSVIQPTKATYSLWAHWNDNASKEIPH